MAPRLWRNARYWLVLMAGAIALSAVSFGSARPVFGGIYLTGAGACAWLAARQRRFGALQEQADPGED